MAKMHWTKNASFHKVSNEQTEKRVRKQFDYYLDMQEYLNALNIRGFKNAVTFVSWAKQYVDLAIPDPLPFKLSNPDPLPLWDNLRGLNRTPFA